MQSSAESLGPSAWILTMPGQAPMEIWGLSTTERLRRAAQAAGVPLGNIGVGPADAAMTCPRPLVIFRSDYVFDDRLVRGMVAAENTILMPTDAASGNERCVAAHVEARLIPLALRLLAEGGRNGGNDTGGLRFVGPSDVARAYTAKLRRVDPPYLLPARPERVHSIERRIFDASYKGVTDFVTKWVWPAPARWVTHRLARRGVRPNAVTAVSWVLVIVTGLLFWRGWFGPGLVCGWIMTFLDTVDGKLARVTLTSSRAGDVLDHGLDLLHPPFWYLAWAAGLPPDALWRGLALAVTLWGYIAGRAIEGLFVAACKTDIHTWRRLDSRFRTVTARRNPNMVLLTVATVAGRPDLGLVAVGAWTAVSIAFHSVRLAQALTERVRGRAVESWLSTLQ
jgi:hypothetical protein